MEMAKQGNRRTLLLGVLLVAAAALGAVRIWPAPEVPATGSRVVTAPSAALDAFMAEVMAASKIADPVERCLHMPDPPDSHWHAEGVEAYCRYRLTDMPESPGSVRSSPLARVMRSTAFFPVIYRRKCTTPGIRPSSTRR